uniref:Mediator of RNA polymerase II transcription subunit 1 n=2 Tax=Schistocephalus solidus TaxID=70667 RepID=A0A0X3NJA2_SCHSO
MSAVGARKHSLEDFFDLLPTLRSKFEDYPACLRRTAFCARFATLRNQLDRIALQCDMKINQTGPITTALGQPAGIAWRLSSECFAVVVSAVPIEGYSLPPGTTPPQDDLASVSAVHFEFNQEKPILCEELVDELRKRNYNALLAHITNLLALYNVPGDRSHRCRAFLCLQVLEEDLTVLSAAATVDSEGVAVNPPPVTLSPRNVSEVATLVQSINFSAIGQIEPRSGGRFAALTYFVSPAQEAIARSRILKQAPSHPNLRGLLKGFFAFVGLRATADKIQHNLPFIPLVNLQKDESGLNIAQFATADSIKCGPIAAEFVLFLHPPLIISTEATADVEKITGIPLVCTQNCSPEPVHTLILRRHNQEALRLVDVHMLLPNRSQHVYHLRPEYSNRLQGYCVTEIAFTSPSQLPTLVSLLRRHAAWLSFVESFALHPRNPVSKDEALSFRFDISMSSMDELGVSFAHPCALERKVQVCIQFGNFGVKLARVSGCNLSERLERSTGATTTPPDPTRVLARSHNLPVAMTWLLILLGCPVNRSLSCIFPGATSITPSSCTSTTVASTAASSDAERHFRATFLARARRALQFSDDCDADGLLSGADQISQENLQHLDLLTQPPPPSPTQFDVFVTPVSSSAASCVSSLSLPGVDAFRPVGSPNTMTTTVPIGGSAALRSNAFLASAPLPPGVLVTTPPSCLLDGASAVKPMSMEETITSTSGCFPPPPLVGIGNGGVGNRSALAFSTPLIPGTISVSTAMFASPSSSASASPSPLKTPLFSTPVPTPPLGSRQSCPNIATTTSSSATSSVSAGSMLVSLLDEDIPPQSVHLPTLNTASLQPSRVISSMLPQPQLPQQQISVHKPSSSDVLNHLLTSGQSEKDSALLRGKNKAPMLSTVSSPSLKTNLPSLSSRSTPSSMGSVGGGISGAYSGQAFTTTTTTTKRQRKRREASPVAAVEPIQFISVLPTRSSVAEATLAGKQSRFSAEAVSASLSTSTSEGGKLMTSTTAASAVSTVVSSEKHKSGRPSSGSSGGGGVNQPTRHTPSSASSYSYAGATSSLVSKSVYDFEDLPMSLSSTTSLSKQPPSSASGIGAISATIGPYVPTTTNGNVITSCATLATATVSTTKSELRITIRPNWTAASSTSVGGTGPSSGIPNTSTASAKPRVVVDGKPSSFLKQMLHSSPATNSGDVSTDRTLQPSFMTGAVKPKKERKRRASSKSGKSLPLPNSAAVSNMSEISSALNRKVLMGSTSTVASAAMTGTTTGSYKPSHGLTASSSGPFPTSFSSVKPVKGRKKASSMSTFSSSVVFTPSEPVGAAATSVAALKPTTTSGGPTKKIKLSGDDATRSLEVVEPTISATSKGNGLMKGYKIPKKKAASPVQPSPQTSAAATAQPLIRTSPSLSSEVDGAEASIQSSPGAPPLRDQISVSVADTDTLQPKPASLLSVSETTPASADSAWTALPEMLTPQQRLPFPQSSGLQPQVSRKLPKNLTDIVEQLRAKSTREHTIPPGCGGSGPIPGNEDGSVNSSGWQQSETSAFTSLETTAVQEDEKMQEKEVEEEEEAEEKNKKRTTDTIASNGSGRQSRPGCTISPSLASDDTLNVPGSDNIFEKLGSSSSTTAKVATAATVHRQHTVAGAGRVSTGEDQSSALFEGSRSRRGSISQELAFDATVASTETSGESGARLVKASTDTPDSPTEDVPSKISASTSSKIIPVSPTSASRKALTVSGPGSSGGSGSNLSTVHAFHEKTIRPPPPPPPINLPARSGANPGGGPRFGPGYQRGSWQNRPFNPNRPPNASFPGHAWSGPRRLPAYRGPEPGPGAPVGLGGTGNWGMRPQGGMFRGHFPGPGGPPAPSFVGGPSSVGPMNRTPTKK